MIAESYLQRYKFPLLVACIAAFLYLVVYFICGQIPVTGGAGWDGSVYLKYIQKLSQGEAIHGDPYRSIRMPGFGPLIAFAAVGIKPDSYLVTQLLLNVLFLSAGIAFFYSSLINIGCGNKRAITTVAVLFFSWPVLVMPIYYPVLSDHAAIALSCASLWLWSKSLRGWLIGLCVLSLGVLPGLFLIPMILVALPFKSCVNEDYRCRADRRVVIPLFIIFGLVLSVAICKYLLGFSLDSITTHAVTKGGVTALPNWLPLTLFSTVTGGIFISWIYLHLIFDGSIWRVLSVRWLGIVVCVLLVSIFLIYTTIDWSKGFSGPPLIRYMALQTLAAPFKPLIAHFYSFGPVIVLSIWTLYRWSVSREGAIPYGLVVLLAVYLPFLWFGSESRQWMGVLPVCAAIFAMGNYNFCIRLWCVLFSGFLIFPLVFLNANSLKALNLGLSFQSTEWQYYFGRQGPWMSVETYIAALMMLIVFLSVLVGIVIFYRYRGKCCRESTIDQI